MQTSTILIVDDEPLGRELLGDLLEQDGYTLAYAQNGAEALAQATALQPDLILLDIMMPDMNGIEVVGRLRDDPVLAQVPVILVTALNDREYRLMGLKAGADDLISKPFDQVEILARVRTITRLNRFRQLLNHRTLSESSARWEAIGTLAAGIAHEINTPIQFVGDNLHFLAGAFARIMQVINLLRADLVDEAPYGNGTTTTTQLRAAIKQINLDFLTQEIPQAIAQSQDGVARVANIVSAMRTFAHPMRGDQSWANLNDAINTTLTVSRNEYKYVADIVCDLDPNLPLILCDLNDLNQAFLNLIVNAAHAIQDAISAGEQERGVITVQSRQEGDEVCVRITDTGPGIPATIRDRVFDPFFTTKPVGKGTGQGLAIVHAAVVEKHRGRIALESEPGKGAQFSIFLPINGENHANDAHPFRG